MSGLHWGIHRTSALNALDAYAIRAYNQTVNYQWDPRKAAINLKKHGVDFADAVGVFEDETALWQ